MRKAEFNYIDHYKKDAEEFDYFGERSGATAHDERRVREYIIHECDVKRGKVLDVGAGSAWVAEYFTKKGFEVVSLDISLINLQKAREKVPVNSHFCVSSDAFALPFSNGSFDLVIASEVIEHTLDPAGFVAELLRVVKKGGELLITTPYKEKLQYSLCIHCNKPTPLHAHIHSFDEKILTSYFSKLKSEGVKFDSLEWATFGNKLLIFLRTYVILQIYPFWLWKFKDRAMNFLFNKPAHIIVKCRK